MYCCVDKVESMIVCVCTTEVEETSPPVDEQQEEEDENGESALIAEVLWRVCVYHL